MSRLLFAPFSMLGGLLAGLIGKQVFKAIWGLFDKEEPPDPGDRAVAWRKVLPALLLQGAIFRTSRGIVDRALRKAFSRLTGSWPGEERPEEA